MSGVPALGFISMQFVRNAGELLVIHRRLTAYAVKHDLQLTKVYIEQLGPPTAVFDLLGSLMESEGQPLVVPTLHHLALLGNPAEIRDHLRQSSHDVLIANKPAERTC
ncbi:hypothetical protein ACFPJ1_38985 [Kribbella qitaiheensis]|uniref:hypothetical protein n=1 Tax=Kribbella qitaiheensis TaxID=1544730 RepID=UPI0036126E97